MFPKRLALHTAQVAMLAIAVFGLARMASASSNTCRAEIWHDVEDGSEFLRTTCQGSCSDATPPCTLKMAYIPIIGFMFWCSCGGQAADDQCELTWFGGSEPNQAVLSFCAPHTCPGECRKDTSQSPNGDPEVALVKCPCTPGPFQP